MSPKKRKLYLQRYFKKKELTREDYFYLKSLNEKLEGEINKRRHKKSIVEKLMLRYVAGNPYS